MITIEGYGAPTTATPGNVGDHYIDLSTDGMYRCSTVVPAERDLGFVTIDDYALDSTEYTWSLCNLVNNQDKIIIRNGTYTADEGYSGFDNVIVDVTTSADDFLDPSTNNIITSTNVLLHKVTTNTRQYVQIKITDIYSTGDYAYRLQAPLSFIVYPYAYGDNYTVTFKALRRPLSSTSETLSNVSVNLSFGSGMIYAKTGSSAYQFNVTLREVLSTAGEF